MLVTGMSDLFGYNPDKNTDNPGMYSVVLPDNFQGNISS